jgi:hypothetical protein
MNAICSIKAVRFVYLFRVILVSLEAVILAVSWLSLTYFFDALQVFATKVELNEEVLKYLMLLPVGLAVWVINEAKLILQEDVETVKILIHWPDYWMLKTHTWVSLAYAIVFAVMSLIPWAAKSGISTGHGMLLFLTSIAGQFCLAISVYAARIRVKEIIAHAKLI